MRATAAGWKRLVNTVSFHDLTGSALVVDAVYEGGAKGNASDDPLSKLLPGIGNMGGFRIAGRGGARRFVVLYTSGEDKDWPDKIDLATGRFTYYGDNKTPGHGLHATPQGGNLLLQRVFDRLHGAPAARAAIPPFFVFVKSPTAGSSRSVRFDGLAVPGYPGLSPTADLVAVWKTTKGQRFQNYEAVFTILDVPVVARGWLDDLAQGRPLTANAPGVWVDWVKKGRYKPLISEPTTTIRSPEEQTPRSAAEVGVLGAVWRHFENSPTVFEAFAARAFQMHDGRAAIDEITRAVVDGGRDAIGRYVMGLSEDPVEMEWALEAKCYRPPIEGMKPVTAGVADVARLVSRIRHRQFGVFVTTSVVARQAYMEVREDGHPIVFISGRDIARILIEKGLNTPALVRAMLEREFPVRGGGQ